MKNTNARSTVLTEHSSKQAHSIRPTALAHVRPPALRLRGGGSLEDDAKATGDALNKAGAQAQSLLSKIRTGARREPVIVTVAACAAVACVLGAPSVKPSPLLRRSLLPSVIPSLVSFCLCLPIPNFSQLSSRSAERKRGGGGTKEKQ